MNEYNIVETHVEDGDDLEETNRGGKSTKTVEKEVLLRMTNIDSSKKQEDFRKQGEQFCKISYIS